jgi:two-component system, NtrC family, nitrogen regulation sensor histidine kinase NtrY
MIAYIVSIFKQYKLYQHLSSILAILSAIATIATYISITSSVGPLGPNIKLVMGLILVDLILFLSLIIIISRKLLSIWGKGSNNSSLQKRIVLMFSLGTAVPTIIVAAFSFIFFNYGIQSWFNEKVSTALEESVAVAQGYLKEHKENIKSDALSIANDLNIEVYNLLKDPEFFNHVLDREADARSLSELLVFRLNDRKILAQSRLSFSLRYALEAITEADIENANNQQVIILDDNKNDRVRGLVKLNNFYNTYLFVGRLVDSKILAHTEKSQGAANEYQRLKAEISELQIQFSFIFLIGAMLLLVASIARGLVFATEIIDPLKQLVRVTDLIKAGDFSARVKTYKKNDEISLLGRSFNLMTMQIASQRHELIEAAKEIDAKRHFNEIVINGISAGIIALRLNKSIDVINKSACLMLDLSQGDMIIEANIERIFPELALLLEQVELRPEEPAQTEINIMRQGRKLALLVRIVAEQFDNHLSGYIITFDDITELLVAQRSAAWSDVAKRIAHEVRNPLTPIRLASERLRKKFMHEVSEPEIFNKYTDTIIRHADSIGGIIDEFVNFARIPNPVFKSCDLVKIIKDAVFSRQCANTLVQYNLEFAELPIMVNVDEAQIDRILINILKNAEEAIEASTNAAPGLISLQVILQDNVVSIIISDNGIGFSPLVINRLSEPYVTTKPKGMGLGLAIVKKIIDDHAGSIKFTNLEPTGSCVTIILPRE